MAYRYGLYLVVHNASETKQALLNKGLNLAPGSDTYIDVSRTIYKKYKSRYSPCIENLKDLRDKSETLANYFEQFYQTSQYDQDFCRDLCLQENIYNKCNCCDIITECRQKVYCATADEVNCMNSFTETFLSNDKTCGDICIVKCETQSFTLLNSEAAFPADYYIDNVLKKMPEPPNYDDYEANDNFVKESVLGFTVNYNSLSYTFIEEKPSLTFSQFVGNDICRLI